MLCYFISGHLDISEAEFQEHYVPELDRAIQAGASFVVGDARGTDTLAQQYLKARQVTNVTVYHMLSSPLNNAGFPTRGGYARPEDKDVAMTQHSTHDIAWVRPMEDQKKLYGPNFRPRISGTEKNLQRRLSSNLEVIDCHQQSQTG